MAFFFNTKAWYYLFLKKLWISVWITNTFLFLCQLTIIITNYCKSYSSKCFEYIGSLQPPELHCYIADQQNLQHFKSFALYFLFPLIKDWFCLEMKLVLSFHHGEKTRFPKHLWNILTPIQNSFKIITTKCIVAYNLLLLDMVVVLSQCYVLQDLFRFSKDHKITWNILQYTHLYW